MNDFLQDYAALTQAAGIAQLSPRTFIELSGRDSQKFLNNFCTADLRNLKAGEGTEAFLLNVKGKVLGHVLATLEENSIVLETVAGQAEKLLPHLDRYTLMDDVTLADRSNEWAEFLLSGPQAEQIISQLAAEAPPTKFGQHRTVSIEGEQTTIIRTDFAGSQSFLLRTTVSAAAKVHDTVLNSGASSVGFEAVEACRIEAGFPLFGRDISDENLPQEVNRNDQAISFTKGCYLGQETVARIDALGHVNRLLVGVKFAGEEIPPVGLQLLSAGKVVGQVTSAAYSPRQQAPLALAYVRTGHEKAGTKLESACGTAEVVSLPMV